MVDGATARGELEGKRAEKTGNVPLLPANPGLIFVGWRFHAGELWADRCCKTSLDVIK